MEDKKVEKKEWTVMIYLAGDNNLSQECVWAIKEMYRVGLPKDNVAVVAQYDSRALGVPVIRYDIGEVVLIDADGEPMADPEVANRALPDKRYDIDGGLGQQGKDQTSVKSFVSAKELKTFILDCVEKYPAKHYMVVLSGHGSGAVGKNFLRENQGGRYLSIPRLRWALEEVNKTLVNKGWGEKIDILGLDACAMSMAEVAYELRSVVDFMVGAEGFEVNTGWPYHRVLELLGEIEPDGLAIGIVDKYVTYYSDFAVAGVSVDQAVCDMSKTGKLASAVALLAATLMDKIKMELAASAEPDRKISALLDAVILAHWRAQSYKYEEYVDLWDFCHLLEVGCSDEEVKMACQRVMKVIGHEGVKEEMLRDVEHHMEDIFSTVERCVLKSCFSGAAYQHSHGLSIYFPWADVYDDYKNLRFSQATLWHEFLEYYVEQSRRQPREGTGKLRSIYVVDDAGEIVRSSPPFNKMGEAITPRVKNTPTGYYTDKCILLLQPMSGME